MNRRYVVKTLGCKANLADSQQLEQELQEKGWVQAAGASDDVELCIVNSCTVTDEADRQSRKWAARLAKQHPKARVVFTGCGAEVDPEGLAKSKGIDFVVGNQNKADLLGLVQTQIDSHILQQEKYTPAPSEILGTVTNYTTLLSQHPHTREWPAASESFRTPPTELTGGGSRTRAFLKIQEGCNAFCTYCIIPYGRGPSRSIDENKAISQIQDLVKKGIREVILTGTNIGEYGEVDNSSRLTALVSRILSETELERLRVSSLDPTEISDALLVLMRSNPRFCPHFHVSLQSPHSRILRLMKRRYGFEEVEACLNKISESTATFPPGGVYVGMDLISGFPGETEEEFQWTLETLSRLPWTRLHVFPYSERKGTPATRLPGSVPKPERTARTRKLLELSLNRLKAHYQKVLEHHQNTGMPLTHVLLEAPDNKGWVSGYSPNYLRVLLPDLKASKTPTRNQLFNVIPTDIMVDSKGSDVALVCRWH